MRYRRLPLGLAIGALAGTGGQEIRAQSATFASLAGASGLPVQRFDIDTPHSAIEFSVRFMGLSKVRGAFSTFGGTFMLDTADVTRSTVTVVIEAASINTNSSFRDRDLKSPSFFETEKYPRIIFTSRAVERRAEGLLLRGTLQMHGVTREVAIPFTELHPLSKDAWGNLRIGYTGALTLNRKDFGILGTAFWNSEFDPGRMSVGDQVEIELTLEAELNNVDRWTTPKGDSVRTALASQGVQKTIQQFRAAAKDSTSDAGRFPEPILSAVGMKLLHTRQFADAVEVYRLAVDLLPQRAALHAGLGEALLMTGKRAEAQASFHRAVALDSANTVAREYLRHLSGR